MTDEEAIAVFGRAVSALAFPPEPGTLTRAEADELRRQGDG